MKKKRVLKIIGRLLLILLVISLAAAVALWLFFPREKIRIALEKKLSDLLDRDVVIESVSLGFYPDAEVVARGVRILDRPGPETLFSARNIRLDLNLPRLLKREYVLDNITIGSPVLRLVRASDGKWNVERLLAGMVAEKMPSAKEAGDGTSARRLDIGPVRIRGGAVEIRDEAAGRSLRVNGIKATVDVKGDQILLASALVPLPVADARLSGLVSHFSRPHRVFHINADARVEKKGPLANFPPKELQPGAKIADVSVEFSGQIARIAVEGTVSLNPRATAGLATKGTLAGTLSPKDGLFEVTALDVSFGQSRLSLAGSCSKLWSGAREARMRGSADILLAEAASLAGEDIASKIEGEGWAVAALKLVASPDRVYLNTDIDLAGAGLTIPRLMRKEPGVPGSISADIRYAIPGEISFERIELALGDARLDGKARWRRGADPWAQASVKTADFPLKLLNRLPSFGFERGTLSLAAQAWQSTSAQSRVEYKCEAVVENALLAANPFSEPIEIAGARFEVETGKLAVESESFSFAKSNCSIRAEITEFERPRITGVLRADTLNIDEIARAFAKTESGDEAGSDRTAPVEARPRESLSMEMLVEADSLRAGKITTGPLSTTWQISGKMHRFAPLEIEMFGGRLDGSFEFDASREDLRWAAEFEGKDLKLENILAQLEEGEAKGEGVLSASGNLKGAARPKIEDVLGSMEGNLQLVITDGEMREYLFLKNIFMLMQFSPATLAVPGLREITVLNALLDAAKTRGKSLDPTCIVFTRVSGTFSLDGGVAHTEDLRLESGIADLLFKGDIDLAGNHLDMRITATPLGSIGTLIEKVPLAGEKLKQAKEAVLSTDFIVRGPISDPEVKLAVIEKLRPKDEEQ